MRPIAASPRLGCADSKVLRGVRSFLALAALVACSEANEVTAPSTVHLASPLLSGTSAEGTVGISDGLTEFRVDTANGEMWVQDVGGSGVIYLEYDEELLEELLDFADGVVIGDENAEKLAVLHPWENSGGEPSRAWDPGFSFSSITPKGLMMRRSLESYTLDTLPGYNAGMSPMYLPEWSPQCPAIAEAIGYKRLQYLSRRQSAFQTLRGMQGMSSGSLTWKDGKPYIKLEDLRNFYISAGMDIASAAFNGLQLGVMRVLYNGNYCQQPIVVGVPDPGSVFIPSGNGSGVPMFCITKQELWEISFDGGLTWYPLPINVTSCSVSEA